MDDHDGRSPPDAGAPGGGTPDKRRHTLTLLLAAASLLTAVPLLLASLLQAPITHVEREFGPILSLFSSVSL